MVDPAIWLAVPTFIFAVMIMWESFNSMLSEKSIRDFLPFFFLSVALAFYTGAIIFEVFRGDLWMVAESSVLLSLLWIFINIWRESECKR